MDAILEPDTRSIDSTFGQYDAVIACYNRTRHLYDRLLNTPPIHMNE